jgi:SAM-dependent methyltransferase
VETHELYGDEYFEELRANVDAYGDNLADRAHEADVRLRFVRRMARSGRLLEIGVAEGHFLTQARESGFDVCGVEPAPETAAASRASGLPVVQGFIEDVALPEEPFNVVCAWHVLEHLVEPLRGLSRIHEALTPDGLLFAEVPNIESDLASRAGQTWPHLQPQYHVCHYGPVALRTVLYRASFDLIELSTVPIFGYYRRAVRFRPTMVVAHVRQSAALGVIPFRGHPTKHELLRVVARVRR